MASRDAAQLRVAFGSCQERLMFPTHCAPNRMGNALLALHGSPERGPGCYDNHAVDTLLYNIQKRPESRKGYVIGARSAPRFLPPFQTITPSPQMYQSDWAQSRVCPPGRNPFNSTAQRFRAKAHATNTNPGPGAYVHDTGHDKKVSWPAKFGSPDWARVPLLERRTLRTELVWDREFRKQRNRLAYLQLFYP